MSSTPHERLHIAAIRFLNPAPLMWDFEHSPQSQQLAARYSMRYMLPSECADQVAGGAAEIGLIPIASLAIIPGLRILPGCTIASKSEVRSLLVIRRAHQPLNRLRTLAADTASRTTIAHTHILFQKWGNKDVVFIPMAANLDSMLEKADAALLIGDPALLALEERAKRLERTGEELVYHDLAHEWHTITGLPFVSAVWAAAPGCSPIDRIAEDFIQSRDHGLRNLDGLAEEWAQRLPLSRESIRSYLTTNIHYVLDEECMEGMHCFFREAAKARVLPEYDFAMSELSI